MGASRSRSEDQKITGKTAVPRATTPSRDADQLAVSKYCTSLLEVDPSISILWLKTMIGWELRGSK
jgi:hypothetical protein